MQISIVTLAVGEEESSQPAQAPIRVGSHPHPYQGISQQRKSCMGCMEPCSSSEAQAEAAGDAAQNQLQFSVDKTIT